tara:strand:+ start:2763 stop:3125 length:363 start_codon:yes stop_codon:yes gene_type:complete
MIADLISKNIDKILYFSIGLIFGLILCSIGFIGFILGVLLGIVLSVISSSGIIIFIDKYRLGAFTSPNHFKYLNGFDLVFIFGTVLLLVFYIFCLFTGNPFFTGIGISGIVGSIIFQRGW